MTRTIAVVGPEKSGKSLLIEKLEKMGDFKFVEYKDGEMPKGTEQLVVIMCTKDFSKWAPYMDASCDIYQRWQVVTVLIGTETKNYNSKIKDTPIGTFFITINDDVVKSNNRFNLGKLSFHLNNDEFHLRKYLEYAENEFEDLRNGEKLKEKNKSKRKEKKEKRKPDEEGWIKV